MAAPLKKVTKSYLRHTGMDMSKRGGDILIVNHYRRVFVLDCGHKTSGPLSAPDRARKRCKKCEALS